MDQLVDKALQHPMTIDAMALKGARVLATSGAIVGKIKSVQFNPKTNGFEGIVVGRPFFRKLYISKNYIEKLSQDAVVLKVDPCLLLKGVKVLSYEGELIGKVTDVVRKENTNSIQHLVAFQILRGKFEIPESEIDAVSTNIILKKSYNVPPKKIWKK